MKILLKTLPYVLFIFSLPLHGQQTIANLDIGKNWEVNDLQGSVVGDGIFFIYQKSTFLSGNEKKIITAAWVNSAGGVREVKLPELYDKLLCRIVTRDGVTKYYFFDEFKKNVVVRALNFDELTKTKTISDEFLTITGRVLASYVEDDNLFLICATEKDPSVRILRIEDLQLKEEKVFNMPQALPTGSLTTFSLIEEGEVVHPDDASAEVKFFKEKNYLYVVRDPRRSINKMPLALTTTISRLDLVSGKAEHKALFDQAPDASTFVKHNKLYRIIATEPMRIDIHSFESMTKLESRELPKTLRYDEYFSYLRDGGNRIVTKKHAINRVQNDLHKKFIIADSAANGEILLTIGSHDVDPKGGVPVIVFAIVSPVLAAGVLVSTLSSSEKVTSNKYFYVKSVADKIELLDKTPLKLQAIDEYEVNSILEDNKFEFKAYLTAPGVTYGIYQFEKSDFIRIVKF